MNYRPLNPQQREILLEKARSYRPRHNPVSNEVLAVIRQVLVAGVEVHGLDTLVRGIADDKKLSTVGGMLARYIPAMMVLGSEPSDLDDLFDDGRIAWWGSPREGVNPATARRDRNLLCDVRIWLSDDPAIAWLDRHSIALASRPKPRYAGGYSLTELAAVFSWASAHSAQVRRDLCVGVVALAFGAGLSTSEIREVKTEDIALDGSTVVVGGSRLSVRDEVCNALAGLRARDVFPLPDTRYISGMKHPQGIHVTPRRLMLSWAVAVMAEGATLQAVASRIPRATALRAVEEVSGFGSWPEGVVLRNVVSDYAGAAKRTKGTRKPKAKAGKQSHRERLQTYPRLRLIEGG